MEFVEKKIFNSIAAVNLKKYPLLLFIAIPCTSYCQQALVTSGASMSNNTTSVNWTIGEIIIDGASSNNFAHTAGMNQPVIQLITGLENTEERIQVNLFPNPTRNIVNIEYDGELPLVVKIISPSGIILSRSEINESSTQLDFSKNTNGVYLIEITDQSHKRNVYKLVKQ